MSKKPLLLFILLATTLVAWQRAPVLLLTSSAEPAVPVPGDELVLTFEVENASAQPLERVVVIARVPSDTVLREAFASREGWTVTVLPGGEVWYAAQTPLVPGQRVPLTMVLAVQPDAAGSISVKSYSAFATGMQERVSGEPLTLRLAGAPTPRTTTAPSTTPTPDEDTATPRGDTGTPRANTRTPRADTATTTPFPSHTPPPTGTAQPSPTPSPTITVVMAVLAPTPTPVLNSEQEQLGTLTISIFVGLTLLIAVLGAVWLIRWSRRQAS